MTSSQVQVSENPPVTRQDLETLAKNETDENGKFVSEKAVVSRVGEYEENPVPEKSGDYVTGHGNTIHYS